MGMNCDNCKYYNWYYDFCDKWKCKVDEREVHSCYEHRRENDKRMTDEPYSVIKEFEKSAKKFDKYNESTLKNIEQNFNNLMHKAFYELSSDDFEKFITYILATLVENYQI